MDVLVEQFVDNIKADLRRLHFFNGYRTPRWPRIEVAVVEFIEQMAEKAKRPPLTYDTRVKGPLKMQVSVFLNQKRMQDVVAYDCEAGYIICDCRASDGSLIIENGEFKTQKLNGSVTVRRIA